MVNGSPVGFFGHPHHQPPPTPSLFPFLPLVVPHIPSLPPYPFLFPPQLPPFGLPTYTFCHPPIPSSLCPPSHPFQPSTVPNKPSVPTPPSLPVISLPKTVTKPVSNLNTSTSLSCHGGRKSPFRIDAKLFSFSFNDGRHDSYVVHESSRHVKHTIWVGRKGFEWILSCFADIRDWVPGNVSICKRFQENNKLLEFCGRSYRASVFVVIAEYYGGAHRGCVMIPASSNRAG